MNRAQRRFGFRLEWGGTIAICLGGLPSAPAFAQTQSPPPPAPTQTAPPAGPSSAVGEVTVTAHAPDSRSTIDARSYSLGANLKTGTGTLADVLRDVPSVSVDTEGNVSLRGDSDVTILVDGKPSALFSGPGRAQAIQSMSASQFERVEVMTNPSAGQTAEGSGGVINLISKRSPRGGAQRSANGTLKGEIGTGDRFDLGANGAYASGRLSLTGGVDFRRGGFSRAIGTRYGIPDPVTGMLQAADQVQRQREHDDDLTLNGALGYDLDSVDHLDASVSLETYREVQNQVATYRTAVASGPSALAYTAPGVLDDFFTATAESIGITRTLPGDGHSLSAKLSLSQGHDRTRRADTYSYTVPEQPDLYQETDQTAGFPQLDLQIDYKATLPNKAKLALGYEGKFDWQSLENQGLQGASPSAALPETAFAERFTAHQQVHAIYATYEQVFHRLTIQPGVRLEQTTLDTHLLTTGEADRQNYLKVFPSAHLDYALSDVSTVKASYGSRIQRPDVGRLDPFRVESTPILFSAGNPALRPAITQSWELGYEYRRKKTDFQATFFYRDKSDVFTTVQQPIGGNVLLSTWANIGHIRDAGLELVLNRDLVRHLTLNASADIRRSEVDAANLGIGGVRTAYVSSGRATLNWQVSANDFVQLGVQASGRELTAQGYYGGSTFTDLGWRHRLGPRLTAVFSAQDPFGLSRRTIATYTPSLVDVQKRKFNYTAAFFSLAYALGGAPKAPVDNFDFGARQGGRQ